MSSSSNESSDALYTFHKARFLARSKNIDSGHIEQLYHSTTGPIRSLLRHDELDALFSLMAAKRIMRRASNGTIAPIVEGDVVIQDMVLMGNKLYYINHGLSYCTV